MKKLKLLEFIENNLDWETKLKEKPYCLTIKRDNGFIMFSYNMIESEFSKSIVQECRGLILREENMIPVCVPFFKFFNVQESHASNINWSTARVQEKLDGSIIKVWHDSDNDEWVTSTNNTIYARNATLSESNILLDGCIWNNYEELFLSVFSQKLFYDVLRTDKTYIFELVSLYNKIVVPYTETKIYHIGTRSNISLEELDDDIEIEKPREFNLSTIEECLESASMLPFNEEGYVVVDKNFNRVKIKSPAYVLAHHIRNNGVITWNRIVEMIRNKNYEDFLSYYPEYQKSVNTVINNISNFVEKVYKDWNTMPDIKDDRKEFAMWAKNTICPAFFFWMFDDRGYEPTEWLWNQSNEKILSWINIK